MLSIHIFLKSHDGTRGLGPLAVHSSKTQMLLDAALVSAVVLTGGNHKLKDKLHLYSREAAASPTSPAMFMASLPSLYNTMRRILASTIGKTLLQRPGLIDQI